MKIHSVEQGAPEWLSLRLGMPTASEFCKIITPTGKASTQAEAYSNRLVAELLTGKSADPFAGNDWTTRGNELEADAAAFYELQFGGDIKEVGFITNDEETFGASPDRLVDENGLLEIKCPAPHTHVGNLLDGQIDGKYTPQVQGQMLVTGRSWVDWLSYHPEMQPSIIRIERDEKYLELMRSMLTEFTENLQRKFQQLKGVAA